jgi:hypothetical protein
MENDAHVLFLPATFISDNRKTDHLIFDAQATCTCNPWSRSKSPVKGLPVWHARRNFTRSEKPRAAERQLRPVPQNKKAVEQSETKSQRFNYDLTM